MSKKTDKSIYLYKSTSCTGEYKYIQHVSYSPNILTVIFGVLFVFMVFQTVTGIGTGLTFSGLLNALSNAPNIDISWLTRLQNIDLGDWGIFNVFRTFIQFIINICSVALYFSVGIAQLVVYVGYIIGFLFGVV